MLKRNLCLLFLVLFLSGVVFGGNPVILSELVNPNKIIINDGKLYITEGVKIYTYSQETLKLIKKMGEKGEGPQEFKVSAEVNANIVLSFHPDFMLVDSLRKVSFFTREGKFIREQKVTNGFWYKPMGDKFIASGRFFDNNVYGFTVDIYNSKLEKEKEIYRRKGWFQTKGPVNIVDDRTPSVDAIGDKIVVVSDHVHFFDKNGKKLFTSTYKFEKIKFKSEHKKLIFDYYNTSTGLRRYYEAVKPRLVFPEYFPAIRTCWVVDEKIYILTFKTKDGNSEIVVLDANGKFVKKVMVPFRELDFVGIYPSTIKDGKFYQLVETADGENWELHISQMK